MFPPMLFYVKSRSSGKERDSETGLDYFGARYYGSAMGRFLSPDWSAAPLPVPYADLHNPQTLNLYAYVTNNPLRSIDPNGHFQKPKTQKEKEQEERENAEFAKKAQSFVRESTKALGRMLQTAASGLDNFNKYLGFDETDCAGSSGDDGECFRAISMAAGTIIAAVESDGASEAENVYVYRIIENGKTVYVGITNNLERRAIQHGARLTPIMEGLSRADARAVEQRLIEEFGLERNGGSLRNKINSIARSNPVYEDALRRGTQLLEQIGFRLREPI